MEMLSWIAFYVIVILVGMRFLTFWWSGVGDLVLVRSFGGGTHGSFAHFIGQTRVAFVVWISAEGAVNAFHMFVNGVHYAVACATKSTVPKC